MRKARNLLVMDELEQAKADLAFALAQGDSLAEDEAAERIRQLEEEQDAAEAGQL